MDTRRLAAALALIVGTGALLLPAHRTVPLGWLPLGVIGVVAVYVLLGALPHRSRRPLCWPRLVAAAAVSAAGGLGAWWWTNSPLPVSHWLPIGAVCTWALYDEFGRHSPVRGVGSGVKRVRA